MLKLKSTDAVVHFLKSNGKRKASNTADNENARRTVSVSVETVIVIVFVDTVVKLVTCDAVKLIDTVRDKFPVCRKAVDVLRRSGGRNRRSSCTCCNG